MGNPVLVNQIIPESDVVPLTGRVGAEIRGIRLGGELSDATVAAINQLLLKHKVIFFRDQGHLDDSKQEAFARRLGDLVPHPTQGPVAGTASILNLDSSRGGGRADQWHTDVTFVDAYPKFSVLRGVVIPAAGGDTIWSNTHAAYESLPASLKLLADNLWAIHSNAYDYAAVRPRATAEEKKHFEEVFTSTIYETEHPVVRVHPETGERSLLLGNFVQRLVGLSKSDSAKLYEVFQSYVTAPENTVRWRWRAGDVVIWDNRATQHYAVNDYGDQHRVVRRATVDGDVPVSVDGRRSVTHVKAAKPKAKAA
ncbi:TauD/TfdA dioxygenase family protein [Rhizobium binxianense]|uniref:TauD/TfdA dioxygenase family protein n=1 Tax=Rhizobium binxianense TaxID=3024242 RepID=UPI00234FA480|nr:TauD/TfdA family dioxygenase [Rhizobium sp. BC56]MDC7746478.1 TauD/TfdA family dioxygenase [Rhizobium sp. BC56]